MVSGSGHSSFTIFAQVLSGLCYTRILSFLPPIFTIKKTSAIFKYLGNRFRSIVYKESAYNEIGRFL